MTVPVTVGEAMALLISAWEQVVASYKDLVDRGRESAFQESARLALGEMPELDRAAVRGRVEWRFELDDQDVELILVEGRIFLLTSDYGGSCALELLPDGTLREADLPEEAYEL